MEKISIEQIAVHCLQALLTAHYSVETPEDVEPATETQLAEVAVQHARALRKVLDAEEGR